MTIHLLITDENLVRTIPAGAGSTLRDLRVYARQALLFFTSPELRNPPILKTRHISTTRHGQRTSEFKRNRSCATTWPSRLSTRCRASGQSDALSGRHALRARNTIMVGIF